MTPPLASRPRRVDDAGTRGRQTAASMPEIRCTAKSSLDHGDGDGSDAREIMPVHGRETSSDWSPMARRLLHTTGHHSPSSRNGVKTDEASGRAGVEALASSTGPRIACSLRRTHCASRSCTDLEGYGLSPDGTRAPRTWATRSPQAGDHVGHRPDGHGLGQGDRASGRRPRRTHGDFCDAAGQGQHRRAAAGRRTGRTSCSPARVIGPPGASGLCGVEAVHGGGRWIGSPRNSTTAGLYAIVPVWSPDGTRIAFHSTTGSDRSGGFTDFVDDIYILRTTLAADERRPLAARSGTGRPVVFIRWTDSGTRRGKGWHGRRRGKHDAPPFAGGPDGGGCLTCPSPGRGIAGLLAADALTEVCAAHPRRPEWRETARS